MNVTKFRVWSDHYKKFVIYSYTIDQIKEDLRNPDIERHTEFSASLATDRRMKWEQYVGFEDYYSKEIYEGDICRVNTGESFIMEGKITMVAGSIYCGGSEVRKWMNPVIIGNVHENPDIL